VVEEEDLATRQQLLGAPVVLVAVGLEGEIYKLVSMLMSIQAEAVEVEVAVVVGARQEAVAWPLVAVQQPQAQQPRSLSRS